ncbi:MAG TPA: type VI secretion system accessory protein TagJ [Chthoniobacteraceae bacterium]|nr:type VI secretion system accessory protein TagJ [Chthoniobacteraceae bacterium]
MTAEESLRAGQLDDALASVRDAVKKSPTEAKPRIFLFQLLSVLGQWEKALTQLQVLRDMDADSMLLAEIFTPVLHCEALRAEVFAGRRSPLIFGEPEEWIGLLVQANQLVAEGKFEAAAELRTRAFDAAPAVAGKLNDHAFEWIADADSRLGPLLEVIMEGKYYWVPFHRIQSVKMEAPTDLRNFVWMAAQFTWTNGGNTPGFIPSRYAGSESAGESSIRLAKKTDWLQKDAETYLGLGQRVLATNETELPLLELRSLELIPAPVAQ